MLTDSEREKYRKEREKFVGVLERFAEAKMNDDKNRTNQCPQDAKFTNEEQELFEKTLNEMRQDPIDDKVHALGQMVASQRQMTSISEEELIKQNCLTKDTNVSVTVLHAYCPTCGEELVAAGPKMFNPYTMESIAKHVCRLCEKTYNLENSYPRMAIIGSDGKEIKAYGL